MKLYRNALVILFILCVSNPLVAMSTSCNIAAAGVAEASLAGDSFLRTFWTSIYRDLGC